MFTVAHGLVILQTIWATIEDLLARHRLTCSEFVDQAGPFRRLDTLIPRLCPRRRPAARLDRPAARMTTRLSPLVPMKALGWLSASFLICAAHHLGSVGAQNG
jgi:hypothetical protein